MEVTIEGKELELNEGLTEEGKFYYVFHRFTKNNKTYDVSVIVSPANPATVNKIEAKPEEEAETAKPVKEKSAIQQMADRYEQMPANFKLF